MTRIARSNVPSLYGNPKLSAKALRNDMNSCNSVFGHKTIVGNTTSSTKDSSDSAGIIMALITGLGTLGSTAASLIGLKNSNKEEKEPTADKEDELAKKQEELKKLQEKNAELEKQKAEENNHKMADINANPEGKADSTDDKTKDPKASADKNAKEEGAAKQRSN